MTPDNAPHIVTRAVAGSYVVLATAVLTSASIASDDSDAQQPSREDTLYAPARIFSEQACESSNSRPDNHRYPDGRRYHNVIRGRAVETATFDTDLGGKDRRRRGPMKYLIIAAIALVWVLAGNPVNVVAEGHEVRLVCEVKTCETSAQGDARKLDCVNGLPTAFRLNLPTTNGFHRDGTIFVTEEEISIASKPTSLTGGVGQNRSSLMEINRLTGSFTDFQIFEVSSAKFATRQTGHCRKSTGQERAF